MYIRFDIPVHSQYLENTIAMAGRYIECESFPSREQLVMLANKWLNDDRAKYFNLPEYPMIESEDKDIIRFFETMELTSLFYKDMGLLSCKGKISNEDTFYGGAIIQFEMYKV